MATQAKTSSRQADALTPPLTIRQTADALGVCVATIYALAKRGEIIISKISGKSVIYRDDLEAFRQRSRTAYKGGA